MPEKEQVLTSPMQLTTRPLTPENFAEFGAVVGPDKLVLTSTEFPFFTNVATLQPEGTIITYLNRHHDHQQIFASLGGKPMIVVVAAPSISGAALRPEHVHAFVTDGATAIVFHIDTWHLAPFAVGSAPIRALNVQAINNHVHTERIELKQALGFELRL
jgi:ureidoglycolate hydrolase